MKRTGTTLADIATAGVVLVLGFAIADSARRVEPRPHPVRRGHVEPERAPPAAERLLAHDDRTALAAAAELADAGAGAAPYLEYARRHGLRADALARLENDAHPSSLAALVSLSEHDDESVAARALLAVARRDPEQARDRAAVLLDRPAHDVRLDVLRAAVVLCDPMLERPLRRLALDAAPVARDLALSALARIGDARAVDSLRWQVDASDAWDRLRIAESMIRADMPEAVSAWRLALRDLPVADRAAAIRALRGPVPEPLVEELEDMQDRAPADVRREIRRTLARAPTPLDANAVRTHVQASVTSYESR
jgi:hypothetical protein